VTSATFEIGSSISRETEISHSAKICLDFLANWCLGSAKQKQFII